MSDVVGLLAYPLGEDFGLAAAPRRSIRRAYRRALLEKANPRSPEYMRSLFAERHPSGRVVETAGDARGDVVLLYPDAIGLGWGGVERSLGDARTLTALNGRGRAFPLDARTRRALALRRVLERSMATEALALGVAAVLTPLLLAADLVRGRR